MRDSSPQQLNVFHALWGEYHGAEKVARPQRTPTRGEGEAVSRDHTLLGSSVGTDVAREFVDSEGNLKTFRGRFLISAILTGKWRILMEIGRR